MTDVSVPERLLADAAADEHAQPYFDVSRWSDASSKDSLRLIAASVAQMVGFEVAVISLVLEGAIVPVIIEGPESVQAVLADSRTPFRLVLDEIAHADDWGRFRFVPHERNGLDIENYGWVPDLDPIDDQHAWHPSDMLLATLRDGGGDVVGLLSIDVPLNGLRPDAGQRQLLERYAALAERALSIAFERQALAERVRLAEATREVVRVAASNPDVEKALDDCREAMLEGFRADDLLIRVYPAGATPAMNSTKWDVSPELLEIAREVATACWHAGATVVGRDGEPHPGLIDPREQSQLAAFMRAAGFGQGMLVPIGAGTECLGHIVLLRRSSEFEFSSDEQQSCFEVARDIGQALVTSRTLEREQRLVSEMTRLATYRTELLSTVSHELKNPLTALNGHLDILTATESFTAQGASSIGAMERASRRLRRVIDDLLLMAEADESESVDAVPVDLGPLLIEAAEMAGVTASQRDLAIEVGLPHTPVIACGDARLLDRVVSNLLSNAIKYGRPGTVVVAGAVDHGDQVEVFVSDQGIGISPEDQDKLFTEFFRSTNPTALAEPGTGLGLSIAARIVARHGGTIGVESTMGEGSTFRVLLPAH